MQLRQQRSGRWAGLQQELRQVLLLLELQLLLLLLDMLLEGGRRGKRLPL